MRHPPQSAHISTTPSMLTSFSLAMTFHERLEAWRQALASASEVACGEEEGREWLKIFRSMPPFDTNPEIWTDRRSCLLGVE